MELKKRLKGLAGLWLAAVIVLFTPLHVLAEGETHWKFYGIGYLSENATVAEGENLHQVYSGGIEISSCKSTSITPGKVTEYGQLRDDVSNNQIGYGAVGWKLWQVDSQRKLTSVTYDGSLAQITVSSPGGYYIIEPVAGALPVDVEITLSSGANVDTGSAGLYFQGKPDAAVKAWYNDCGERSEIVSPDFQYCITEDAKPQMESLQWTDYASCTGEDGTYTLYVKTSKADGTPVYQASDQFVIDSEAPVICDSSGNELGENAELASDGPATITVREDNLKEATLDGTAFSGSCQVPADGLTHTVTASDMAGNQTSRRITVTPAGKKKVYVHIKRMQAGNEDIPLTEGSTVDNTNNNKEADIAWITPDTPLDQQETGITAPEGYDLTGWTLWRWAYSGGAGEVSSPQQVNKDACISDYAAWADSSFPLLEPQFTKKASQEEPAETAEITGSGAYSLKAGTLYQLDSGQWKVSGDETVYEGSQEFYVAADGEYEFVKQ